MNVMQPITKISLMLIIIYVCATTRSLQTEIIKNRSNFVIFEEGKETSTNDNKQ